MKLLFGRTICNAFANGGMYGMTKPTAMIVIVDATKTLAARD